MLQNTIIYLSSYMKKISAKLLICYIILKFKIYDLRISVNVNYNYLQSISFYYIQVLIYINFRVQVFNFRKFYPFNTPICNTNYIKGNLHF